MAGILHIIDARTSGDRLDQLRLLAEADEAVVSAGPPPAYPAFDLPVAAQHRPLGLAALSGWRMRNLANDAEIVQSWSADALEAAVMLRNIRAPRVLHSLPGMPRGRDLARVVKLAQKRRLHAALPTAAARGALIAAGAPAEVVQVLPPAAPKPPADVNARRQAVRAALGVKDNDVLMAAPAEMTRWAGHKYASWSHAIVRQILENLRLLLPGGGPADRYVRFFAATTGYDPEVFFTGGQFSRADCLAAADIACFLDERESGVSALVEAMAAGSAIIASATPDHLELLGEDSQAALLASPGDPRTASAALLKLTEDPDLRRRLGEGARSKAVCLNAASARAKLTDIRRLVLAAEAG